MAIDSRRIAKNTIFLFFRFLLILGVTFYVSRVLLDKLGVEDYGLYNVVYGVIGLLAFINGTLASSTSRFITYALGTNNKNHLCLTFTTTLYAHVVLALIVSIIAASIGVWYIYNVLVVPPDRFNAVLIIYLISVISTILSILQVPFTAEIIAHERMDTYAFIGMFDAFARFSAAFALTYCRSDRLVFYAFSLLIANFIVFVLYICYAKRNFSEVKFSLQHDKVIFKDILNFSGWNLFANFSNTLMVQGVVLLFNIFFFPVVVAAQAIGNQISNGIAQLINNVRSAVNPQVVKLYANNDIRESEKLTLLSAEYIFYLLMMVCIPCILVMPTLLNLWLKEVPEYTVVFARFLVFQLLLENFNNAYYQPLVAANKIKLNSIIEVFICLLQFLLLYVFFKLGYGPLYARYFGIAIVLLLSFIEKPLLLWKYLNYDIYKISWSIIRCLVALSLSMILNYVIYLYLSLSTISDFILIILLSISSVFFSCMLVIGYKWLKSYLRSKHK